MTIIGAGLQKQERQAEVKELEQSISKLKKQLDIAVVEQIEAKCSSFQQVMIDQENF